MKKSLLTLGLGVLASSSLFAQLPVSTTAENKNVVLEEFTGIYCTFCPDGHLRASNLAAEKKPNLQEKRQYIKFEKFQSHQKDASL